MEKFGEATVAEMDAEEQTDAVLKCRNRYQKCMKAPSKESIKKARKSNTLYEDVDENQYRPLAKCVTFKSDVDRMALWIAALQLRYHDNLAARDDYLVEWTDQPSDVSTEDNMWLDKIEVVVNEISQDEQDDEKCKIVTITIYLTTLTIMVQGNGICSFISGEFPVLKEMVNALATLESTQSDLEKEEMSHDPGTTSAKTIDDGPFEKPSDCDQPSNMQAPDSNNSSGSATSTKEVPKSKKSQNAGFTSDNNPPRPPREDQQPCLQQIANCLTQLVQVKDVVAKLEDQLVNKVLDYKDESHRLEKQMLENQRKADEKEINELKKENERLRKENQEAKNSTTEPEQKNDNDKTRAVRNKK